jgi:pimeloyl-ACP methyl ester carboxylesterase
MRKFVNLIIVLFLFTSIIIVNDLLACGHEKVNWIYKGSSVSEYDPELKHFIWETDRPPYGPWDKIALHQFVKQKHNWDANPYLPSRDPRKVLFIIPGTWDRGAPKGSNPNVSETWFFAAHDYDVYSIEFRTGYIKPNLAYEQFVQFGLGEVLKGTADWTYGAFREDIKACIELAKRISGAKKLFLAGRSRGGTQMYIYAAKYWKEDLKGLIGLDGSSPWLPIENPGQQKTESEFLAAVQAFKNGTLSAPYNTFLSQVSAYYDEFQFAAAVPYATTTVGGPLPAASQLNPPIPNFAPADKKEINFVSDLVAWRSYYSWGAGKVSNYYKPYPGGQGETYMDRSVLLEIYAIFTRYWPRIQDLEAAYMTGYSNCPFLDYDDVSDITLPILHFFSELGCVGGSCLNTTQPYKVQSTDITLKYLPGYGHLDVYAGTHSLEDVKQPMLEWMNERLGHHKHKK